MSSTSSQVNAMISRFSPDIAARFRKARSEVRALFPRGFELVYDNYNAFGCGYSTTLKSSGVVISVVAYPRWVTVFFFHGARLPDPEGILQGSGSRIRSIRLDPPSVLKSRAVRKLLNQAIAPCREAFGAAPRLSTHMKSIVAKRLPRRPKTAHSRSKSTVQKRSRTSARVKTGSHPISVARRNIGREILDGLRELKAGASEVPAATTANARSYTVGPIIEVRIVEDFLPALGSGTTGLKLDREWSAARKTEAVGRIRKKLT